MTGKGLVPLERGEMEPLQDAASDCFRLLLGRSRTELGTPADCGFFIKATILACKKGEIKLSQDEADQLKAMLKNDRNVYGQTVPTALKDFLLDVCNTKVGQTVTIDKELRSEGRAVAKDLFRLGDDPHEFETRLNTAASLFDAAMVRQMKPVSDQEMLAYYKNRQPTNDNNQTTRYRQRPSPLGEGRNAQNLALVHEEDPTRQTLARSTCDECPAIHP
eukprot:gene35427-41807_t